MSQSQPSQKPRRPKSGLGFLMGLSLLLMGVPCLIVGLGEIVPDLRRHHWETLFELLLFLSVVVAGGATTYEGWTGNLLYRLYGLPPDKR